MAVTPSSMLDLGTVCPDFNLPDTVSGKTFSPDTCKGTKGLLVMFICNHCPYVQHVLPEFKRLAVDYIPKGIGIAAINANDTAAYPQDGPVHMRELAAAEKWKFPFLWDETQAVAKKFRAACTPDFFLFDHHAKLVYRGQIDEARPGNGKPVNGKDLRAAMDAVLLGKPVSSTQMPSIGCNIKWRPGHEPRL